MQTDLFLIIPPVPEQGLTAKEHALMIARYISGNPDETELPTVGELTDPETGESYRYNIFDNGGTGLMHDPETGEPVMLEREDGTREPAYCITGRWHGSPETVPPLLARFQVDRLPAVYA